MSDQQLPPAERPGNETSEFRLTLLATVTGLILVILGAAFNRPALEDNGTWIVIGAVGTYTASRSFFKGRTVSK
jgi:hypothetical protein